MPSESRVVRPHILPDLSGPAHLAHLIRAYKGTYGFGEVPSGCLERRNMRSIQNSRPHWAGLGDSEVGTVVCEQQHGMAGEIPQV